MKLYLLTNMYCIGTQAAIQGMHAGFRMLLKYSDDSAYGTKCVDMINDWNNHHETVVVLNAGNSASLANYIKILHEQDQVPWDYFCEPGLDNALTAVAVLCSTEMVEDMADFRTSDLGLISGAVTLSEKYGYHLGEVLEDISKMRTA